MQDGTAPELISIHFKGQEFLIRSRKEVGAEVVVRRPFEVVTHIHKSKQAAYREKGRQAACSVKVHSPPHGCDIPLLPPLNNKTHNYLFAQPPKDHI